MAWSKGRPETTERPGTAGSPRPSPTGRGASLGPSIVIKGSLSGQEDLLIEGRVEGEIALESHNLTIGESGRVKANIRSRSIRVEGEVEGDLFGDEEISIRRSGKVRGNVTAPRVSLENGSKFKGSIDMQPQGGEESARRAAPAPGAAGRGAATPARERRGGAATGGAAR